MFQLGPSGVSVLGPENQSPYQTGRTTTMVCSWKGSLLNLGGDKNVRPIAMLELDE
jgi:hypothetical protein